MWLVTKIGFFSVVCAHGRGVNEPHPDLMMIRARDRGHLVALRRLCAGLPRIVETEGTDYPYRIIAPRAAVMAAVGVLAEGINYTNYKQAATVFNGPRFIRFIHDIWYLGLRLTPGYVEPVWYDAPEAEAAKSKPRAKKKKKIK